MNVDYSDEDVRRSTARALAKQVAAGEPKAIVYRDVPGRIRELADQILREGQMDLKAQKELRRARITELIVDPDPDTAAKGIALSQKEEPPAVQRVDVGWAGHWGAGAPDGGELESEGDK